MLRAAPLSAIGVLMLVALAHGASVWPQPLSMSLGKASIHLDENFTFSCTAQCPAELQSAFKRYQALVFVAGTPGAAVRGNRATLGGVDVQVSEVQKLDVSMDESYNLTIEGSRAVINATSQWGAMRALESFSQLVNWTLDASGGNTYAIDVLPVYIHDAPRFPWRGMLLDSARHYLTVPALLRTIDAMAYNKFNVLHWHIVDKESFPLDSATYPDLAAKGAFAPEAVYSVDDVKTVVSYAYDRGVRVVPEFDMPAHAASWAKGMPQLGVSCSGGQTLLTPTGATYDTLKGLLSEFSGVFTDEFVHLGGDEVESYACWEQSSEVQAWAAAQGLNGSLAIRQYFEEAVENVTLGAGHTAVFWEETFETGAALSSSAVVDVWLSQAEAEKVIRAGHRVVYSYGFYLDQQVPLGKTYYFGQDVWKTFYGNEPLYNTTLSPEQQAMMLGGEASMWGEQVDATVIDARVWPRACATAERLWSAKDVTDVDAAAPRLAAQRCRLVQRGIGAGPFRPSEFYNPYCHLPLNSPWRPHAPSA